MADETNNDNVCMCPGCDLPVKARGHCAVHYNVLRKIVANPNNGYTWKKLGEMGIIPVRKADSIDHVDTKEFRKDILTKLAEAPLDE